MCNLIMGLPTTQSTAMATRAAGGKLPKKKKKTYTKNWEKNRKNYKVLGSDHKIPCIRNEIKACQILKVLRSTLYSQRLIF